jgi:hypothetical protein
MSHIRPLPFHPLYLLLFSLLLLLLPLFSFPKAQQNKEQKPEPKPSPCVAIITRLAPTPPPFNLSIHAYAQTQKDIIGTSTHTAPVHAGVKLDIPLLDTRELYERQLKHLANLQKAQDILSQYLKPED